MTVCHDATLKFGYIGPLTFPLLTDHPISTFGHDGCCVKRSVLPRERRGAQHFMGTFVTNLHVRDADRHAVIEALRSLDAIPAFVRVSPEDTWTSIFPEAVDQDQAALSEMASNLSKALNRPVIAFLVHDSDIFLYWLYDGGKELDRYNSAPGYFTGEETPPEGGNPDTLAVYGTPRLSTDRLLRLLHPERIGLEQPPSKKADRRAKMKDAVLKKLRQSYPALAAKMVNPP